MIFGISVNTSKPNYETILKNIWITLKNKIPNCKIKIFLDGENLKSQESTLSFLFIVGGDGTILRNVSFLKNHNTPLIGINYGTLGFLASVEIGDIEKAVEFIRDKNFYIENRIMLNTTIDSDDCSEGCIALNDIAITKLPLSSLLRFKIFIDDKYYSSFSGDGIIIATPTGSTAYSLSAGGPIISPDIESIIITPICPHSLNAKSLVISSNSVIKLEIDGLDDNCYVIVDGQRQEVLKGKQFLKIRKHSKNCPIIRFDFYDYYSVLREKLINRI